MSILAVSCLRLVKQKQYMSHKINVSVLLALQNTEIFFIIYIIISYLYIKHMNHSRKTCFWSVTVILVDLDFK